MADSSKIPDSFSKFDGQRSKWKGYHINLKALLGRFKLLATLALAAAAIEDAVKKGDVDVLATFFQSFGWQAHGVPAPRPFGTPKQCPWAARLFQALPLHWCSGSATSLFCLHDATEVGLAGCFKFYRKRAGGWRPCPPNRPQWSVLCGGSNWLLACGMCGGCTQALALWVVA